MPTTHRVKLRESFVRPVLDGRKRAEVRKDDRGYQPGDKLVFVPVTHDGAPILEGQYGLDGKVAFAARPDSCTVEDCRELAAREYEVTYVACGWGLRDGFVCVSFREKGGRDA